MSPFIVLTLIPKQLTLKDHKCPFYVNYGFMLAFSVTHNPCHKEQKCSPQTADSVKVSFVKSFLSLNASHKFKLLNIAHKK